MTATAAQILQVRRMTDEPTTTTYADATIQAFIEQYPLLDERGEKPYVWDTSTSPPTQDANDDWIATYDLNAAAAVIWEEKAAAVAEDYDFSADGGNYSRSQVNTQFLQMAAMYRSRRASKSLRMYIEPKPTETERVWVGNLAEKEDKEIWA